MWVQSSRSGLDHPALHARAAAGSVRIGGIERDQLEQREVTDVALYEIGGRRCQGICWLVAMLITSPMMTCMHQAMRDAELIPSAGQDGMSLNGPERS